jgi:signal transduction histidine kinase
MKHEPIEPGLLSIFRLLLCIQLGLTAFNVLAHQHLGQLAVFPFSAMKIGVGGTLVLLIYLSWPWLQHRLGKYYLPIALASTIFLSLLVQAEILQSYLDPKEYSSNESAWFLFMFLFFSLVLVAWQYSFRAVILYSIFSAVLEVLILHVADYAYHDLLFFDVAYQRIIIIRTTVFLVAGYVISRVMTQLRKQRQEMVEANRRLSHYAATLEELGVTQERNRMARELHDTLAHTLSGLAVQLEAARSLWESTPRRAEEIIEEALDYTRKGLTETRKSIKALRAGPLDDLGLIQAIGNLAEIAASRIGASLDLVMPKTLEKLPPDVEHCIYRVAQEALENAIQHSEAKKLDVRLDRKDGRISLLIMDDGRGFDPGREASRDHFGLKGMQERVEMLGGKLEIHSRPEQGTTVRLSLELKR